MISCKKRSKKQQGKESKLVLDCKTRWHSLLFMVESVLKIKRPLLKVLQDNSEKVQLDEKDMKTAENSVAVLRPVFFASLSKRFQFVNC